MKINNWLVIACVALGLSLGFNVYQYFNGCEVSDTSNLEHSLDRVRYSFDSLGVEKSVVDSLLLLKPTEFTVIKRRYVKIHDTIDLRDSKWNDSVCSGIELHYRNNRERFSVSRFPNN